MTVTPRSAQPLHRRMIVRIHRGANMTTTYTYRDLHRDLPPATPETITAAELECLHLIAGGHTNPQIAKQLWISTGAVGSRVRRLLFKLGAHDRAQAVHHAWRHGLLGGDQ